jgi:hypothetical protein
MAPKESETKSRSTRAKAESKNSNIFQKATDSAKIELCSGLPKTTLSRRERFKLLLKADSTRENPGDSLVK